MRVIDPDLDDCLRRPNPYVETYAEVAVPDVGQVLRRKDQFEAPIAATTNPVGGLQVGANGELRITPTVVAIANFAAGAGFFDLNGENEERRRKGITWQTDPGFIRALLRNFQASVVRYPVGGLFYFDLDWQLQIFRITRTPGAREKLVKGTVQSTPFTQFVFTPILSSPAVIKAAAIAWGAPAGDTGEAATLNFDLSAYNIVIENTPGDATRPDFAGEMPLYHFVISPIKHPKGTGFFRWLCDNVSARTIANVGTFERVFWARENEDDQWVATGQGDVPRATINVENYAGTSSAQFALDFGKVPNAAGGAVGRVIFERSVPGGAAAKLEISPLGTAAGPWLLVRHGDEITPPPANALAHWAFDDDTAKDISGNGVDGVVAGGVTYSPGKVGRSADFDGATGKITGPAMTLGGAGGFSVAAWIRRTNPNAQKSFFSNRGPGGSVYAGTDGTGKLFFYGGPSAAPAAALGASAIPAATWVHVAITNDNVNTRFYINGALDAIVAQTLAANTGTIGIGWDAANAVEFWDGSIDDLLVFSRSLALSEIVALYKAAAVAPAQQTYRARVSLTAGTGGRSSPGIRAFGIEYRIPVDVSAESAVAWPTREIAVPWMSSSIPEGKVKIVRTGSRDYDDPASRLAAKYSPTKLEVDVFLRSKHPAITRDKWLLLERLSVTNRVPNPTSEEFALLSYLHRLKKKIPEKRESVSSTHTVQAGSTAAQLIVSPVLPGVTAGGNELDGKHFYIRVPKTTKTAFVDGFVQEVSGNTNVDRLDFAPALPDVLNTGDVIELHSGVFGTAAVVWQDYDPADVWYELLTTYAGVPAERVGHGSLPRGGRPPKVTDRAPGDGPTQAKLKVTFAAREDEPVDEMIDQVSFICGGATVEISGQICYVQVYPLYDATGKISVPLPAIAKTFDPRDYFNASTSPALEGRTTVVTGIYGVNAAAANKDAYPERLTVGVDVDAVAWLTQQSIEAIGNTELPEKVGRWLYNSSDAGLYLATQVIAQVVRAGSTGLRVFGFSTVDQYPELTPGDVVVMVTDQYTDYDPATARELRGWLAVKGVLVKTANGGRAFGMYVLGLADNVTTLKGFGQGSLAGVGEPPGAPLIVADFNSAGKANVSVFAGEGTVSAKIAVDTAGTPSDATVEATAAINADIFSVLFNTPIVPPGGTLYIKLFEYTELDGGGVRSQPFTIQFQRPVGVAQPPVADILVQAESQTAITLRLTGTVGQGGTGPLQYRYRIDTNGVAGAWTAWGAFPSGGGTYIDVVQSKNNFYARKMVGQVRDASPTPVESALVYEAITGKLDSFHPTSGRIDPVIPMNSGYTPFQYGLDNADGVLYSPATGKAFIHVDQTDATIGGGRVVAIKRSGVNTEPTSNIFKRGTDTAADVVTTTVRTFVDPTTATQVDGSGRIVGVYRAGVIEPVNNLIKFGDALGNVMATSLTLTGAGPINQIIQGSPTQNLGIQIGSSSVFGIHGSMQSSGYQFISYNAYQNTSGADSWTQSLGSNPSGLFEVRPDGVAGYGAPAGRAVGNKGTFWNATFSIVDGLMTLRQQASTTVGTPTTYGIQILVAGVVRFTAGADTNNTYLQSWATQPLYLNQQGNPVRVGAGGLIINGGGVDVTGNITQVSGFISTTGRIANSVSMNAGGQLRATGWWTSGDSGGLGFEGGVSAGQVYVYAYNRTSGLYGIMNFGATSYVFQGPATVKATDFELS